MGHQPKKVEAQFLGLKIETCGTRRIPQRQLHCRDSLDSSFPLVAQNDALRFRVRLVVHAFDAFHRLDTFDGGQRVIRGLPLLQDFEDAAGREASADEPS